MLDIKTYMNSAGAIELVSDKDLDAHFLEITKLTTPDIVCDIGSRDGEMAADLKKASSSSNVFAFEPNPENFFDFYQLAIQNDVCFVPLAIGNDNTVCNINVPHHASKYFNASKTRRGIASLRERVDCSEYIKYLVPQVTISTFFQTRDFENKTFSFWIDVEGGSYEVLEGIDDAILKNTIFLKIEVETFEVWKGQKTAIYLVDYLDRRLFKPGYWFYNSVQFDIIFFNKRFF